MRGYNEMLKRLEPKNIIALGVPFQEMQGNIIPVDYLASRKVVRWYGRQRHVCSGKSCSVYLWNRWQIYGVKILQGIDGKHGLPESSHSSNAYIKLKPDGTFHEMRIYDNSHTLRMEIAYHPEKLITGNNQTPVLHYHTYDERFSRNSTGSFTRSPAKPLSDEMKIKYQKYFRGIKLWLMEILTSS